MDDTRLTLYEVKGSLRDIQERLSGKEGRIWHAALNRFLRKENPWPSAITTPAEPADFPVWKTIKLGTGLKTADEFIRAILAAGRRVDKMADYVLRRPTFLSRVADNEEEVDLVVLSGEELGQEYGARLSAIFRAASKHGLQLCPVEVGPQLRIQFSQSWDKYQYLRIASERLIGPGDESVLFTVFRDEGVSQWLDAYSCSDDHVNSTTRFVFVKPRLG